MEIFYNKLMRPKPHTLQKSKCVCVCVKLFFISFTLKAMVIDKTIFLNFIF